MKNKLKQLLLLLLLPVVAASSVLGLITPQTAFAAPVDTATIDEKLKSYMYYNMMSICVRDSQLSGTPYNIDGIEEGDAGAGRWFDTVQEAYEFSGAVIVEVGLYASPSGPPEPGKLSCGDPSWVNEAVGIWGYSSNIEALCSFGYTRNVDTETTMTVSECVSYNGSDKSFDFRTRNAGDRMRIFQASVNDKYYDGGPPSLDDPMKYILFRDTFFAACDPKLIGPEAGATVDQKAIGNGANGYILQQLNDESPRAMEGVIYEAGDVPETTSILTSLAYPSLQPQSFTCQQLVDMANDAAPAYERYAFLNPDDVADVGDASGSDSSVPACQGGSFGWILCPALDLMRTATEFVASVLDDQLKTPPLINGENPAAAPLFDTWENIRDIANIMFVIAFFVVIFSQSTSLGLSAYGIRKLLPRIIAAAILVNLSYYFCAIAIDISNIVGSSIIDLIEYATDVTAPGQGVIASVDNAFAVNPGSGVVLVGAAIVLFIFAIPAAIAVLVTFFVIAFRNAIILLLVIVAPIAFVAWLLPNTQKYFKKWLDLFVGMLVLYPAVMFIFGAATLASAIVVTGSEDNDTLQKAVALIIQALPLFALPFLFKLAGGALSKIQSLGQQSGMRGAEKAKKKYQESNFGQYRASEKSRKQRLAQTGSYNGVNPLRRGQSRINRTLNRSGLFNAATGNYGGHRVLDEQRQTGEDQKKTQDMLNGDFDLATAWVRDGGRQGAAYRGLSRAQQIKYDQMRGAGYNQRASSYSAALSLMADAGVGNQEDVQSAMTRIDELTPNREQAGVSQAGLSEYVRSAYRKAGRGDMVRRTGAIDTQDPTLQLSGFSAQDGVHYSDVDSQRLMQSETLLTDAGWNEVSMSNLSRHAIDPANAQGGRASFQRWVGQNDENLRKVVVGLDSMEARARQQAVGAIAEMQSINPADTQAVAQLIDQYRVQFGLRQGSGTGAPPP